MSFRFFHFCQKDKDYKDILYTNKLLLEVIEATTQRTTLFKVLCQCQLLSETYT